MSLRQIGIHENLRFLLLEVRKQVERTHEYMHERSQKVLRSARVKDDYVDNLKSIIQRKVFNAAADTSPEARAQRELLKAVDTVAVNLERIADFCVNIVGQLRYIEEESVLWRRDWEPFYTTVMSALDKTEQAVLELDVEVALQVCQSEVELDRLYDAAFREILVDLEQGEHIQTYVTTLFIARYFERIGDALLNIGEAVLSAALGERIKIDQFWALEGSLEHTQRTIEDVKLRAAGESKSGCRIDRVSDRGDDGRTAVIFKEGEARKVLEEKDSIERWHQLKPGLAPKVFSVHDRGATGAILFEYLRGATFEDLLIGEDTSLLAEALGTLIGTVRELWLETREPTPVRPDFVGQLRKRLPDVYAVHPGFANGRGRIEGLELPSLEDLLDRAESVEKDLAAPFSVFIHGDFNVDNIIYDIDDKRLNFIDLHRSRMMDYVQDVTVFMVSNHRLQIFDSPVRRRIEMVARRFFDFAQRFAQETGDETFEARAALGLARSYATSTRFVLDGGFARDMFLRARYLVERVVGHGGPMTSFRLPEEVLGAS